MTSHDFDVGIWTSEVPYPLIFGEVEQDDICSEGEPVKTMHAYIDYEKLHKVPCGVICAHFTDRGNHINPRSRCSKTNKECSLAPHHWEGKVVNFH